MFSIFISCNKDIDNSKEIWLSAKESYIKNDFDSTVVLLSSILDKFPASYYSAESMYLLHEIYLNEYQQYDIALLYLSKIINNFPDHELSKKSLFTIGYIYSNHLSSYSDAYIAYDAFIKQYPNDALVPSAQYEIDGLKPYLDDIQNLLNKK